MQTADLAGAIWLPGDGRADPADVTAALARGARQRGVVIRERTRSALVLAAVTLTLNGPAVAVPSAFAAAALEIRRVLPGTPVVVLSRHLQRQVAVELLAGQAAGVGYLLKQRIADVTRFCDDLRRVCAGGTALDPEVITLMVARARASDGGLRRLTARQQEVLELMAQGRSNASIARALSLTERAVVGHVSNIYDQLGLPSSENDHRRVLAVVRYLSR